MMQDVKKYVFVGNREYVLKEMIRMGLNIVGVYVMENCFLHRRLQEEKFIDFVAISKKKQLLEILAITDFDILVSNGCKYILPINDMKEATYINVHPSYLPDLKGMDSINGACLFNRTSGAVCHVIDAGVDTGEIIARVGIPMTDDVDTAMLFQLCFKAEVMAFKEGYDLGFVPMESQPVVEDAKYNSITESEFIVDFNSDIDYILRQIRAFGYESKGLFFKVNGKTYKFFAASEVSNPFVLDLAKDKKNLEVVLSYEKAIVFKFGSRLLKFYEIDKRNGNIPEGAVLESCTVEDMHNFISSVL